MAAKTAQNMGLWCNGLCTALGLVGLSLYLPYYGLGAAWQYMFLSCLYGTLVSIGLCICYARKHVPERLQRWKYSAASTSLLSLVLVLLLLGPAMGYRVLLGYLPGVLVHVLFPLACLVSYVKVDRLDRHASMLPWWGMLPTAVYVAAMCAGNGAGLWRGPYAFFRVREQPLGMSLLWCSVFGLLAWYLSVQVRKFAIISCIRAVPLEALPPLEAGYTEDGYIQNQDCFGSYRYRRMPAGENCCGCVAAFNLRHYCQQTADIQEILREMDHMHVFPGPGPTRLYVMRRYLQRYLPGFALYRGRAQCIEGARGTVMGIFRYWEEKIPHYVSYIQVGQGAYRFFNVSDEEGLDFVCPMDTFTQGHFQTGSVHLFCYTELPDASR